jgi:outer membrane protein TolC
MTVMLVLGGILVMVGGPVQGAEPAMAEELETGVGPAELPELGEGATLADYVAYAELRNPGLAAAYAEWRSSLERVAPAGALPDPQLSYGRFLQSVETRVGPQRQKLALAQKFPWRGKRRLRSEVAREAALAKERGYWDARLALVRELKQAYGELYYLGRAIEITRGNYALLEQVEPVLRIRFQGGTGSHADLLRVQVELGKLEDHLVSLEDRARPLRAKLNALLARPADAPLPWPSSLPEVPVELDKERLLALAFERNPRLLRLAAQRSRAELATALAGKAFYPDVMVGFEAVDTGRATMAGVEDSGKDPLVAKVSLNLPIWQGKYRAEQQAARLQTAVATRTIEDLRNKIESRLENALYQLRDAERRRELYGTSLVTKAEQALHVTMEAFVSGRASLIDYLDAERTLLGFQLALERARADRLVWTAEIEYLTGGALPVAAEQSGTAADAGQEKD